MIVRTASFFWIFFLFAYQPLCALPLAEHFKQAGYIHRRSAFYPFEREKSLHDRFFLFLQRVCKLEALPLEEELSTPSRKL